MIDPLVALILVSNVSSAAPDCEYEQDDNGHLASVCSPYLDGADAYSITMRASLNPRPASQQVMIHRMDGKWYVRIAGYRWKPGTSVVETRRNEVSISDEDAESIALLMDEQSLLRLAGLPYYGDKDVICLDGATFELAKATSVQQTSITQHSCAGKTELNTIAAAFRRIAIKYDAEAEGMLSAFRD